MTNVNLTIDGVKISVPAGTTLLEAAATIGTEVPHYCYHPGLSIAGNCRMCLVMVEKMSKPVIACKTIAAEGMAVDTKSPTVKGLQASIMEFLLINHPLDCPTCDQAGECRLQDYYMNYDLKPSRMTEAKVHKDKMVDLGSGVMLDEERCIVCTRCVRFCEEIAGNPELMVQERGDHSMVATFPGKKMTNAYAGCTIDVCPVGALTSKDFRFKKRVWLLAQAQSVCPGCSRGCNIEIHHADRKVYRLKPRFNPDVNAYWMCDYGRYDYKFINESRRLRPGYRTADGLVESSTEEVLHRLTRDVSGFQTGEIAFIASAQESNEAIDALVTFAQDCMGVVHAYYSKNAPESPHSDGILITPDKNPNLAHVQKLMLKPVPEIPPKVKAVIVQRNLSPADLKFVQQKNLAVLCVFATNSTDLDTTARVILPIPTFAEQSGHFTNIDGRVQAFAKAFEPRGEARPIRDHLADLEKSMAGLRRAS